MTGPAALMRPRERPVPRIVGGFDQMRDERDQITLLLRGLAARLEELDRTLADLAWHSQHTLHRPTASATSEFLWKGTTLRVERERLSARLGVLARQLGDLDDRLATDPGSGVGPLPTAGVCPECGYPSLGSGLCAFCRPHLAR